MSCNVFNGLRLAKTPQAFYGASGRFMGSRLGSPKKTLNRGTISFKLGIYGLGLSEASLTVKTQAHENTHI